MLELENGAPSSAGPAQLLAELKEVPDDLESIVGFLLEHAAELPVRATLYERRGGEWSHLHAFDSLAEVTPETIREAFGGGRYQARFRRVTGGHLRATSFPVSGPKIPREGETPPAPSSEENPRLERLERTLERLLEKLTEAPRKEPSADLVGLATAMAQAQAPLLAALAQAKAPAGPDMAAFGELLIRAIELGREGGGGGGGGYGDVVRDFGGPLLQILNRAMAGGGDAPRELTPAAPAAPTSEASSPPAGSPGWLTQLGPLMPQLLQLAQLHADVDWWAAKILEGADEASLAWIRAELERRPEFEAEFYAWVPKAVPHKEWFDGFWEALADELADDGLDGEELEE